MRIRGYADKIVKIADALKANIVNTDGTTNVKANNLANSIINAANRINDELDMLGGYKENLSTEIDMDDFNNH